MTALFEEEQQNTTPSAPPPRSQMRVSDWRPMRKGVSLQGFFTATLPSGMTLHDLTYHRREDGARWIGMPARSYVAADGDTRWQRLVDFIDKSTFSRFQKQALAALDRLLGPEAEGSKV
jgi:hypothetical protein